MTGIVIYESSSCYLSVSKLFCEAVSKLEAEIAEAGCVLMQLAMADYAKNRGMVASGIMLE